MKSSWGLLFLLLGSSVAFAEQLSVGAQVDKTEIAVGERLTYVITISGPILETPKVQLTHFEGFEVLSTAQSQQIQMKAGQMRLTLVLTYLLMPTTAGTHTLGPLKVEYQGQVVETQPIEVKVTPGERPEAAPPQAPRLEGGVVL